MNQEDLTLWETLVHLTRKTPLGNEYIFTAHGILKAMKLGTGGMEHERLYDSITRLTGGVVHITHEGKTYFGTLIEGGRKDEISKVYSLRLNHDLIFLYGDTQYTAINIETLYRLSGSQNKQIAGFKRLLKIALNDLVKIGFLLFYAIEGYLVSVQRNNNVLPQTENMSMK